MESMPTCQLSGPAGVLEALFEQPSGVPRAAVVFAHPHPLHGGTMHTKVVYRAAKTFLELGCAVLRFNFRGVGDSDGEWDEGRGEQDDFLAALDAASAAYPGLALWSGGFSFGAWVALTVGTRDPRVTRLLAIAPPVGRYDCSNVTVSPKPIHFIHGEQDELVPLEAVLALYQQVTPPKTLTIIEGANHLFDKQVGEVGNDIRTAFRIRAPEEEQA